MGANAMTCYGHHTIAAVTIEPKQRCRVSLALNSCGCHCRITLNCRMICRKYLDSLGVKMAIAVPVLPARPVRPHLQHQGCFRTRPPIRLPACLLLVAMLLRAQV